MGIKLIQEWFDKSSQIKNYIYESTESGLRLVFSENKYSKDFNLDVILTSGSNYEDSIGVTRGTSHFLEHMLCKPNKKFKTKHDLDIFKFGDVKKAEFYTNASTNPNYNSYYGYGNANAKDRIIDYILAQFDYPFERLEEFFNDEKKIIIEELKRNKKADKDSSLGYAKLFYQKYYPRTTEWVPGFEDSVIKITIDDLIKFYNNYYTTRNCVIAVQAAEFTKKEIVNLFKRFEKVLPNKKPFNVIINTKNVDLKMTFRFGHFKQDDLQTVFFSINYFNKSRRKLDYKNYAKDYIGNSLIYKFTHDRLREELNLIYGFDTFSSFAIPGWNASGLTFETSIENFLKLIDEVYEIDEKTSFEYLKTEKARMMFQSKLSTYIYERTVNFDPNYAASIASSIHYKQTLGWDKDEAAKVAASLKIEDIAKKRSRITNVPSFWFISPYEDDQIIKIFKKSKYYKKYIKYSEK